MRYLYSLVMYLLIPFVLLRLWWKGRLAPAYRERIAERFCLDAMSDSSFDVWIHAVSLGEVIAVTPLIQQLLGKSLTVLVTTMTPTGAKQVERQFGQKVVHRYLPYDLPLVWHRFFKKNKPQIVVIMETELWPNLITMASYYAIPLVLINARLSESSARSYQKIRFFFKPLLNRFQAILTQTPEDARRFCRIGADEQRVSVGGNVKFDVQIPPVKSLFYQQLKNQWGKERLVIIAASTHEGEEALILSRWRVLKASLPDVLLLIAPRHPERFQTVFELSIGLGFNTGLRSNISSIDTHNDVIIIDSLGELSECYPFSDYAFVGGSLVAIGGHNVLEPIAAKILVLTGKFTHNFTAICRDLHTEKAIEIVEDVDQLIQKIIFLSQNQAIKIDMINRAYGIFEANQGAVARYSKTIDAILRH